MLAQETQSISNRIFRRFIHHFNSSNVRNNDKEKKSERVIETEDKRTKKLKILVVDDDKSLNETLSDIIAYHKFKVKSVYSGEEAINLTKNEHFDLIFLDVILSAGINGVEVYRELEKLGYVGQIVFMSVYTSSTLWEEAKNIESLDHQEKPIDRNRIIEILNLLKER